MECDRVREAISARIDGEDPGVPDGALEAHLATLCRLPGLAAAGARVTRRARLGGAFLERDLTARVLAAIPPEPARRRRAAWGGGMPGGPGWPPWPVAQLAITVPLLILGHDHRRRRACRP